MDVLDVPPHSLSTSRPAPPPKRRGPPPQSCESCRYRRVKCVRLCGPSAPCEQCNKKGIACTAVQRAAPAPYSGRRIETAKQLYGSLASPSSSSTALALVPSGLSTRLADGEMSETLGLELLTLYGDAGTSCCEPLFPPPVYDFVGLRQRYQDVGRRLSDLSLEDQLISRIIFATAARLQPSPSSHSSTAQDRPPLQKQLLANAQARADAAAVWRSPSPNNAVSLLLLYQLVNGGEIGSAEAKPYLAALVGHLRALEKAHPEVLAGESGSHATALVWCLMLFDTFAAVEREEEPIVPDREYETRFRPAAPNLPSINVVRLAAESDPWSFTNYLLVPVAGTVDAGRRLSRCLDRSSVGGLAQEEEHEIGEVWERLSEICSWASEVVEMGLGLQGLDSFAKTLLQMYTSLAYGAAVFAQLAIVIFLEKRPHDKESFLLELKKSFPQTVAQYSRNIRVTTGSNNFLTVFTGSAWSCSRLALLSHIFCGTNAWDVGMHPGGMTDKLLSLDFLLSALSAVNRSYPSADLAKAIQAVETEQKSLRVLLGDSTPSPTTTFSSSASPSDPNPSLLRISTWTHMLDKQERHVASYPKGFAAAEVADKRIPIVGNLLNGNSNLVSALPDTTWAELGFDYRPASSAGRARSSASATSGAPSASTPSALLPQTPFAHPIPLDFLSFLTDSSSALPAPPSSSAALFSRSPTDDFTSSTSFSTWPTAESDSSSHLAALSHVSNPSISSSNPYLATLPPPQPPQPPTNFPPYPSSAYSALHADVPTPSLPLFPPDMPLEIAEGGDLASFLASLVNEAGPSPPRASTFASGGEEAVDELNGGISSVWDEMVGESGAEEVNWTEGQRTDGVRARGADDFGQALFFFP